LDPLNSLDPLVALNALFTLGTSRPPRTCFSLRTWGAFDTLGAADTSVALFSLFTGFPLDALLAIHTDLTHHFQCGLRVIGALCGNHSKNTQNDGDESEPLPTQEVGHGLTPFSIGNSYRLGPGQYFNN